MPCSVELASTELSSAFGEVGCGSPQLVTADKLLRTVCNSAGHNVQALTLADGRDISCIWIEAQAPVKTAVNIYLENDPSNIIYDSQRDGQPVFNLPLTTPIKDSGVYRIELNTAESDPGAWVTVGFAEHPE